MVASIQQSHATNGSTSQLYQEPFDVDVRTAPIYLTAPAMDARTPSLHLFSSQTKALLRRANRPRIYFTLITIFACLMFFSLTFMASSYNPFRKVAKPLHQEDEPSPSEIAYSPFHPDYPAHANAVDLEFATGNGLLELSPSELRNMVSRTNGYFARDWSLNLGWNNMRYIIDTALFHSKLLNRTLILPSFVYARACEYHIDVCARYARTVNKNDALGSQEWRHLPYEKQQAFVIPLQVMMDIPYLRQRNHSVMLMSEYLELQGLDRSRERSNGAWDREYYHRGIDQPDLFVIANKDYDPKEIVRLDRLPSSLAGLNEPAATGNDTMPIYSSLLGRRCNEKLLEMAKKRERNVLDWSDVKEVLGSMVDTGNESAMQQLLEEARWAILHTWKGSIGMEYVKSVVEPIRQVASFTYLRGFAEDYGHIDHDIILLEGEIHLGRKPGSVRFSTTRERDEYANTVLHDLRPSEEVRTLAARLVKRMDRLSGGRQWLATHMRRGDFVAAGWINEPTLQGPGGFYSSDSWGLTLSTVDHFKRIMNRLELGRQILQRITGSPPERYDVPSVTTASELKYRQPPLKGDPIYMATDERSEEGLKLFRDHNVKLFGDLVTMKDRRFFGWSLLYTDVIALVEQQIIGLGAGYFYAHGMSSFAGGITNLRAASGCDSRTAFLDY